jgi:MFS family permease
MDGGWAWVVLFAAFFSLSLTGATMFAAGVLMSAILDNIENDVTKASWIGAVHISVTCMSGPFVGIVLNSLGARLTAFIAGIVLAVGLIAAAFANSIITLIFTHGLIAGVGSGFILNTMFVIVGQYFNRYRGLACGVLATGSGAGMLAGGSILTSLFNNFGLSGTYMLWGGVTLHTVIFALLLRPSPEERLRAAESKMAADPALTKRQEFQGDLNSMMSGMNSLYSADQHSMFSGRTSSVRRIQRYPNKLSRQDVSVAPLLKTVLHRDMSRSTYSVATNRSARSHIKSNLNIPASPTVAQSRSNLATGANTDNLNTPYTPSPGSTPIAHSPLASNPLSAQDQADQAYEKLDTVNEDTLQPLASSMTSYNIPEKDDPANQIPPSSPTNSRAPSELHSSFRKRLLSGISQSPSQYTSTGRLSYRPSIREQLHRNDLDNESLASTLVSHLQPQDALNPRYRLGSRSISSMMGSIASFPTALAIVKDDLARIEATDRPEIMTAHDYLISFLDSLRLLRNKPFLVFISTCMLWALADAPFSLYLPVYAKSKGSSQMQAASLYTGMGFGSMCGRFLSGLVASDTDIGPILLHIGCLGVASLVVSFSPLFTSTYFGQLICSGLFGLYTGSLVPLSSLITIELLGIGELGLGFGFLSMAQGIGYLAGPPILGAFIERIGYETSFVITGFIFVCASTLAMVIAILLKNATDEEDLHDSFEDLERALRRISDTEDGSDDDISNPEEDHPSKHIAVVEDSSPRDVAGDGKEELKLVPLAEEGSPAAELETITEEA